jgi:hypothetical protein
MQVLILHRSAMCRSFPETAAEFSFGTCATSLQMNKGGHVLRGEETYRKSLDNTHMLYNCICMILCGSDGMSYAHMPLWMMSSKESDQPPYRSFCAIEDVAWRLLSLQPFHIIKVDEVASTLLPFLVVLLYSFWLNLRVLCSLVLLGVEFWLPGVDGRDIWTKETRLGIVQPVRRICCAISRNSARYGARETEYDGIDGRRTAGPRSR